MKKLLLLALVLTLCPFLEGQAQSQTPSRKRPEFSPHSTRGGFAKPAHSWFMKGDSSEIARQHENPDPSRSLPPHLRGMPDLPPHLAAERRRLLQSETGRSGLEPNHPLDRLYPPHKRALARKPNSLKNAAPRHSVQSFQSGATQILSGGVQEAWVARHDGPGSSDDHARDMVVDAAGNIYVTGYSQSAVSPDYLTVKYNAAGVEQWAARYNGSGDSSDYAVALAVDGTGNVYVTGRSWNGTNDDYATVKYNSAGQEQWVARYNGPEDSIDYAVALAVDDVGNVYVTGSSYPYDYATIKYNSAGIQEWIQTVGSGGNDPPVALAIDGASNVYVTGSRGYDYYTVKYNSAGKKQWTARYDGPEYGSDLARALAVDGSGNVYVTGGSAQQGIYGNPPNYATVKYNSAGQEQWVARYNGYIFAHALAVDGVGNVYVTGDGGGYITAKYNSAGTQEWVATYDNGDDFYYAVALAVDNAGNVYVTGIGLPYYGNHYEDQDYTTVKYNSAGTQEWVQTYNGPGNGHDDAIALAVDNANNVYVTGSSIGSNPDYDFATIKYTQIPLPIADAGPDKTICAGSSAPIGGSPTGSGGKGGPYAFSWSPATGLDNPTAPNPIASPAKTTTYTVTVTETATGLSATDEVTVTVTTAGWSVAHIVDVDDVIFGINQDAAPRNNRGLALSPDERFLYLGYTVRVRKIDLSVSDPAHNHSAVVAQLNRSPGTQPARDIATDDRGRVYLALGTKIEVYNSNLQVPPLHTISGFTACEGVATRRENGALAVYATDRLDKTLERFVLVEGTGEAVTSSSKTGLDGDGEVRIIGAKSPRGLDIANDGTAWIADFGKAKVYRVNSAGATVDSTAVRRPMDIAIDKTRGEAYVSQDTLRTIKVLNLSNGKIKRTLTPPAADLNLDLDGETGLGALLGIDVASCQRVYVANEKGRSILTPLNGDSPFSNVGDNNDVKAADTDPVLVVTSNVLAKEFEVEESEIEESEVAKSEVVTSYQLAPSYPNPFNPSTVISFQLPVNSEVRLAIYNSVGQLVRELVNGEIPAGRHIISWDGRDQFNNTVAAGVYLYRITATGKNGETAFSKTQRMTMVK